MLIKYNISNLKINVWSYLYHVYKLLYDFIGNLIQKAASKIFITKKNLI